MEARRVPVVMVAGRRGRKLMSKASVTLFSCGRLSAPLPVSEWHISVVQRTTARSAATHPSSKRWHQENIDHAGGFAHVGDLAEAVI